MRDLWHAADGGVERRIGLAAGPQDEEGCGVVTMMKSPPSINIARLTYLLVCEAAGVAIALSTKGTMF